MADLVLKVTPEEVQTKASEISSQKDMMSTYLSDMRSKIDSLRDAWESPAADEYYTRFATLAKEIQDSLDALTKHVNNLNDAAEKYTEAENQQKSLVDSLDTSDIFN